MKTPEATYSAHAASSVQDTVHVLYLPDVDGGTYFATEPVIGLSGALLLIQERLSLVQSQTNPLTGVSDIGGTTVVLVDAACAVTELRRDTYIRGQEAEVWEGYAAIPWADYFRVLKGKVKSFKRSNKGASWTAEITDRFDQAATGVFKKTDLAAEPWTGGDKSFDSGSLVLTDTDGDSVYDRALLTGNPVTLGLKMLLSGGEAANEAAIYNVWPAWAGAGLTEDDVDVAWCEAERIKVLLVDFTDLIIEDEEDAKDFVETEVCKALGGHSLLSGAGKIRMHFPSAPVDTATLQTVSDSNLLSDSTPEPADDQAFFITHIVFKLGYDGSGYTVTLRRASPQYLDGQYKGEERVHTIESRGLQVATGGVSNADAVMDAFFARFGDPPPRCKLGVFYAMHTVEAGDVVRMTSEQWPDIDGLGVGGERLLEVLSVKPAGNRVELDTIDLTSPLTSGQRAIIAPNSQADWASATDAEKAYAYIADATSGTLSDGTAAMVWG